MTPDLDAALAGTRRTLLDARTPAGIWEGRLSSSALSTATACVALELAHRAAPRPELDRLVVRGLEWLRGHANRDGGYGDTTDSPSNPSTTTLAWAALGLRDGGGEAAARWLERTAGSLSPEALAEATLKNYGVDKTFSAPILTMCALSGRFGGGAAAWTPVPALPFELAALPRGWFGALGLPVVSYALPALIAIGQARHRHLPAGGPLRRLLKGWTSERTLRILQEIQPESGGYLEATPLTGFVVMSLAGSGLAGHPVARKGVEFLVGSAREDGSWAIDTNLATWTTTLAVQALGTALPSGAKAPIRGWLLGQQTRGVHPYTRSAPGAWAWTDRSGGVPDADDTPGALLALAALGPADDPALRDAARRGAGWLLGLQNRDGGIPTFCRGWGKLPFDRSCPDLTAHAIRAWAAWPGSAPPSASARAFDHLVHSQAADGSWIPLWFGNQSAPLLENPVYGTSRVLRCAGLGASQDWTRAASRGAEWLVDAQHADGGWGGAPGVEPTIEETALATEALAPLRPEAARRGAAWLAERTRGGTEFPAAPIGLYFAKLWYSERLYPVIFTAAALAALR
jgi:squalene-hopene/tetraprenyl-beta-curcumene cyclase